MICPPSKVTTFSILFEILRSKKKRVPGRKKIDFQYFQKKLWEICSSFDENLFCQVEEDFKENILKKIKFGKKIYCKFSLKSSEAWQNIFHQNRRKDKFLSQAQAIWERNSSQLVLGHCWATFLSVPISELSKHFFLSNFDENFKVVLLHDSKCFMNFEISQNNFFRRSQ